MLIRYTYNDIIEKSGRRQSTKSLELDNAHTRTWMFGNTLTTITANAAGWAEVIVRKSACKVTWIQRLQQSPTSNVVKNDGAFAYEVPMTMSAAMNTMPPDSEFIQLFRWIEQEFESDTSLRSPGTSNVSTPTTSSYGLGLLKPTIAPRFIPHSPIKTLKSLVVEKEVKESVVVTVESSTVALGAVENGNLLVIYIYIYIYIISYHII